MEIAILAKFKNNNFRKLRLDMGFPTVAAFCRATGFTQSQIGKYENFQDYPKKDHLKEKLERAFKVDFDYLFPPEYRKAVDLNLGRPVEKVVKMNELPAYMEQAYLLPSPEELYEKVEIKEMLEDALGTLTEREAKVVRLHFFEDMELQEIADQMNVCRNRIWQIKEKALRKLKHPVRSRKLRKTLGLDRIIEMKKGEEDEWFPREIMLFIGKERI